MAARVALITGGNTGIGLALAERLLQNDPTIHLCLACRNRKRAEAAVAVLKAAHPDAKVDILLVDVSNVTSVYKATKEIKDRYKRLDYLYLNAGIMPGATMNWAEFWDGLFSKRCIHMFKTGDRLLKQVDDLTPEGLKQIFSTNVFGHFVMIRELEDMLGGPDMTTQIIWTSSSNAKKEAFDMDDIQHFYGQEPYAASKYATDLLSVALNEKLNKQGIYSHTTCPGLVMTNLTYGILPRWFWIVVFPVIWLLRLFTSSMTYDPFYGAECLVWLSQQTPALLDPLDKYHSSVSILGSRYTTRRKMKIQPEEARELYHKLCRLQNELKGRLKV